MTSPDAKKRRCPSCGANITGRPSACPSCGKKLVRTAKIKSKPKPKSAKKTGSRPAADRRESESTQVKKEDKRVSCPKCSFTLLGTESTCPRCGQVLKFRSALRCENCGAPIRKGLKECPNCGIPLDKIRDVAKPTVPLDSGVVAELPGKVIDEPRVDTRHCPSCNAIVPSSFPRCPLCNTSFAETKPPEEAAKPDEGLPKVQLPEDSALAPVEEGLPAKTPTKHRKLKAAKAPAAPAVVRRIARGRTTGVGHANGLRKVSGTDATKGEAFVNGTGVSNGLGARPKESSAGRASFLTRWQILAVLVAIAVVIPAFVFLSYSDKSDEISIDGDFADWDGATTYGTKIPSTSSTSNITEWAIRTQASDLFLYLKTQELMMSSTNPESFYLFVDSDGSDTTGYITGSIGADYLLQITGWDSAVTSASLSRYASTSDRYNWNAWTSIGSLSYSLDLERLEAGATLPVGLGQSAKFVLVSRDSADRGSVSYTAPLVGGVLVVEQVPSAEVAADGIMPKSGSVAMLSLRFTCEGEGGRVDGVSPTLTGATLTSQEPAFSLAKGAEHVMVVSVNTSAAPDGQLVSAEVLEPGIVSSFACVEIVGSSACAYVGTAPSAIAIDGAFADWVGKLSVDQDSIPVTNPGTDIDEVGNVSDAQDSFFYVSVEGDMCSGTFVPAQVSKPSGYGGGGALVLPRRTAEDVLKIFIDSDKSNSTGNWTTLNSKQIGADQLIEVKGLFGKITSMREYDYLSSGNWVETTEVVQAAKDTKRIEIGVSATSIGGSTDIDFIVETTTWKDRSDLATFDPSSMVGLTRTWIVDPTSASPYATSMSYQRKMFYDGINYWSFFYDGGNTVHKYSADDCRTWIPCGSVFTTPDVNETSIWYDSSTNTVYAVGDTSSASNNVSIQVGTVDASAHEISWAARDSSLNTSRFSVAGKNTYISKDSKGVLWILSSNCTQVKPAARYQLTAFRSTDVNTTDSWVNSGQMLAAAVAGDNAKGSIVPSGSGNDVWAVYAYAGNVAARKFNGVWQAPAVIYVQAGSMANTDNSPPSVVVDGKGVVHVVYGTGRRNSGTSTPSIEYSHNNTDLTSFSPSVSLDPLISPGIGDYYPTISLETSTGDLHVLWLQSDTTFAPKTVVGRICVSGSWSTMTIEPQTSFTKQYLTSVYSVAGEFKICWMWTQNTTTPFDVLIDHQEIPEFGDLTMPIIGLVVIFAVYGQRLRSRKSRLGRREGH